MIDTHCHILPNIDHDGPKNTEEVLGMARLAERDGIHTIVATPHLYEDTEWSIPIDEQVLELNKAIRDANIQVEILPGAEASANLTPSTLKNNTINGRGYILIEFSLRTPIEQMNEVVYETCLDGMFPIVAHAERLPGVQKHPFLAAELVKSGALIQVTAESLTGGLGVEARICARYLLREGLVHLLASDAHSSTWRKPLISVGLKAAAGIVGDQRARCLVMDNPGAVIHGKTLNA